MESCRQQLQAWRVNSKIHQQNGEKPVLEEFIPLKQSTSQPSQTLSNISDRANWMTSAQLWSQTTNDESKPILSSSKQQQQQQQPIDHQLGFIQKLHTNSNNRGAFLPFSKDSILSHTHYSTPPQLPDLALAAAPATGGGNRQEVDGNKCGNSDHHQPENGNMVTGKVNLGGEGEVITSNNANSNNNTNNSTTQNGHRKARRCWSPDLHRRFVNALQMLGGSQGE